MSTNKIVLTNLQVRMNEAGVRDIEDFLKRHSEDFSPAFHTQNDIAAYAAKVWSCGNTYELWHNGILDALLVVYFSEKLKQVYVPYICTAGCHYGPHAAQYLFSLITGFAEPFQFIRLEVRKNNARAVNFYHKQGFVSISETNDKYLMQKELKMKKP